MAARPPPPSAMGGGDRDAKRPGTTAVPARSRHSRREAVMARTRWAGAGGTDRAQRRPGRTSGAACLPSARQSARGQPRGHLRAIDRASERRGRVSFRLICCAQRCRSPSGRANVLTALPRPSPTLSACVGHPSPATRTQILGYGGNMIREMEACTGARVSISPVGMRDAAEGCRVVTLSGTPVQVAQCRWEVIRAVGETGVVQERSRGAAAPADLASRGGGGGGGGQGRRCTSRSARRRQRHARAVHRRVPRA